MGITTRDGKIVEFSLCEGETIGTPGQINQDTVIPSTDENLYAEVSIKGKKVKGIVISCDEVRMTAQVRFPTLNDKVMTVKIDKKTPKHSSFKDRVKEAFRKKPGNK